MENENKYFEIEEETSIDVFSDASFSYPADRDFTTLDAWKKSRELRNFIYKKIIPSLPPEEKYSSGSQMRRAALSITNNIAEGYGRFHFQEGIQFYRISRGSIYELKDDLIFCFDNGFIDRNTYDQATELLKEAKLTLNGFINYVIRQKEKGKEV